MLFQIRADRGLIERLAEDQLILDELAAEPERALEPHLGWYVRQADSETILGLPMGFEVRVERVTLSRTARDR